MIAPRTLTVGVVVATLVGLVGFDIYAYVTGGEVATISDVVTSAAWSSPRASFLIGLVVGGLIDHWFITGRPKGAA